MLRKTFKYRCYPNKGTRRRLFNVMRRAVTPVWNACVGEREEARVKYKQLLDEAFCDWVMENKRDLPEKIERKIRKELTKQIDWPTAYSQYKHCRKRDNRQYAAFYSKMLECTVAQVDGSEKSFRALWLKGRNGARPPRQQNLHRCITFRSSGWRPKQAGQINRMEVPAVTLSGIGRIKVRLHRRIGGQIKTVSISEKNGRWYALFSCEVTEFPGACGSLSPNNSSDMDDSGQKHACTVRSDPEKGGAHNVKSILLDVDSVRSDPEKGGAHNAHRSATISLGVRSDPEKGGAHNTLHPTEDADGVRSDPEKGGTHRKCGKVQLRFVFTDGVFLEDSAGLKVNHPEFYFTHIEQLRRLSRAKDRKKRGSKNRRKARRTLARFHEHIAAKRDYFLWHVARFYAMTYEQIIVPKWPLKEHIEYAVDAEEARKLCDSAYAKFIAMLRHKCKEFGTELVERKDEQWESQMQKATEVAKREKLSVILRKARTAVKRDYRGRLKSLETACERLTMLRIS